MLGLLFNARSRLDQNAPLCRLIGIGHIDLHQEAIQLGFGQRIGALLLNRVLGCQHMEGTRQIVPFTRHCHMIFLHRLQQSRLRTRAGAVDFIGHQKLGEHRPLDKAEFATAIPRILHHLRANNVRWHQIGCELHATGLKPEHKTQRLDQSGLRQSRHADKQRMPAREQGYNCIFHRLMLAENHLAHRLTRAD